ncbi:TetR/AcrR family transcriptional regulator [Lysinibacillus fusiformis]|uniref:TetR/AcrR family transcriptional regulator n=1 Tax=Lysinibacillus fusiformis TaxID=28031 RepID=UPI001F4D6B53|nr:TetR/AcrR family transcriptional regulator [Lysinibacillus fusiformis]MCK1989800.1 TetR/AcrR family transcriptional regulator [Lysinibacillus fusiformis]
MNKEDQIRDLIIQTSLSLFNKKGYNQTSIQDIMTATALPKGAIYRRFENKNDIAIASFTHSMKIIWDHYFEAIKSKITATDKIIAMFEVYQDAVHTPPVDGGCPLLNTAIESDDGFPELHELAANSHKETLLFLQSIIEEGIHAKEFSQHVNAYSLASFLFSTLEGAVMSSRLALNNDHMNHSIEQTTYLLQQYAPKNQEV